MPDEVENIENVIDEKSSDENFKNTIYEHEIWKYIGTFDKIKFEDFELIRQLLYELKVNDIKIFDNIIEEALIFFVKEDLNENINKLLENEKYLILKNKYDYYLTKEIYDYIFNKEN
jgi:hypothetical protein